MTVSLNGISNYNATTSSAQRVVTGINAGDVWVIAICSPSSKTISSVTGLGVTWTLQASVTLGSSSGQMYVYTAIPTTNQSSATITVNLSGSAPVFISYMQVIGSSGSLDAMGVVTNTGFGTTLSSGSLTTHTAGDGVMCMGAYASSGNPSNVAAGWTELSLTASNETAAIGQVETGTISGGGGSFNAPSACGWAMVTLAFTPTSSPVTGTWASTEAKDTFSARGGTLSGTWASTEAKDTFSAAGNEYPTGTWESTEAKDVLDAQGFPAITGTWASTEAKDSFAATGKVVNDVVINMTLPTFVMNFEAREEFVGQIHMTLKGFGFVFDVTEIIPVKIKINMTLPGFSMVFEVEEVPASFFVSGPITMNLRGFGFLFDVTTIAPLVFDQAQENGRGGGIAPRADDHGIDQATLELFRNKMYARGIDAVVPSHPAAHYNLTTQFSPPPRPVTAQAPQGKPRK